MAFYCLPPPSYNNLQLHDIVQTLSNETLQWWDKVDKYYAYNTGK